MRRLVVVVLVLVVAAGGVYAAGRQLAFRPAPEVTPSSLQSGPVRSDEVRCSGRVIPVRWLGLSFGRAGRVARVAVEEGAQVSAGDLLAELEGEDYSLELRAAEERLNSAQAQLAQAQATPAPERLRAAQAQLAAAQARLDALKAGPTAAELEAARLRVDQARNALWGAQASRDAIGGNPHAGASALDEANARVASAEIAVRLAELEYERVKAGASAEELAAAEAEVARAQETLAALQAGATAEEQSALRAGVAQAEVEVEKVRAAWEQAEEETRLYAPFAGVVTSLAIREGQAVVGGAEALVLADLSELQIETIDLTELDVAAVYPDQPVEAVVPGSGTPILQGRVSAISPQATLSPVGQAQYRVVVSLNRQEPTLRWGMTANLSFGKRIR